MKKLMSILLILSMILSCSTNDSIFQLSPQQSMSITGKGAGQDAAYNPYMNQKSISVVKNLGKSAFNVRIQMDGEIIKEEELAPQENKEFLLEKGYELYLDSTIKGKAKVTFKKYDD